MRVRAQVPDVFQIIVKEKGVFTNVTSPSTKAKLRILFEVAPLALLVRPLSNAFDVSWHSFVKVCQTILNKYDSEVARRP